MITLISLAGGLELEEFETFTRIKPGFKWQGDLNHYYKPIIAPPTGHIQCSNKLSSGAPAYALSQVHQGDCNSNSNHMAN